MEKKNWELRQGVQDLEGRRRRTGSPLKKILVVALVLILAVVLVNAFGGNGDQTAITDDQTAVPDEPVPEPEAPQPQPDLGSWWETFTGWAAGAWQSIQDFFTGLLENRGNNQPSPPVEPEGEEELPAES